MPLPEWLPELLLFEDSGGDWEAYLEHLYNSFVADFLQGGQVFFQGRRVALKRHPVEKGKEATFWHLISDGRTEADRIPDMRRCERIRWLRAIMDNHAAPEVKMWRNVRRGESRICLWLEDQDYLGILSDRGNYVLPWTAYMIRGERRKHDIRREFESAQ